MNRFSIQAQPLFSLSGISALWSTRARRLVLLCTFTVSLSAAGQSRVTQIILPTTPYVFSYSPCREHPPADPVAQEYYKSVKPASKFTVLVEELNALRSKPVESLTPVEREVYFLLLPQFDLRNRALSRGRSDPVDVLEARAYGKRLAQHIGSDSYERCAWLSSEFILTHAFTFRGVFTAREREVARDDYIAFLEDALAGRVRVEKSRYRLQAVLGSVYLDKGYAQLPDTANAAVSVEAGASQLLMAAAASEDDRHINGWERYSFMLNKLPTALRTPIVLRLIAHAEATWAAPLSPGANVLRTYIHLLNVGGDVALAAKDGKAAISVYKRYLKALQRLRQLEPADPNHEVSEVLAYLLFGDANLLDGRNKEANSAHREAERLFLHVSDDAKGMLEINGVRQKLELRHNGGQ